MKLLLSYALAASAALLSASAAAIGGLADLIVYDRSEGRTLPVYWHEGRPYVIGKPGNEYQLQLRNRQGDDILAVMSVDGVNVVTGETAAVQQNGYVLGAGRSLELKGWRKDLSRTAAFYFTSLPDSYAARTGRPDNVGAIGVAIFRRKRPEPPMEMGTLSRQAPAAAKAESRAADRDNSLGTGHGRSEYSPVRMVDFERASSTPAETIVLYYDSQANLVARGIVPPPRVAERPLPRPFPSFVPDPPA